MAFANCRGNSALNPAIYSARVTWAGPDKTAVYVSEIPRAAQRWENASQAGRGEPGVRGKVAYRHVLYRGEIKDVQRNAWERTIAVIDERGRAPRQLALFPVDRAIAAGGDTSGVLE